MFLWRGNVENRNENPYFLVCHPGGTVPSCCLCLILSMKGLFSKLIWNALFQSLASICNWNIIFDLYHNNQSSLVFFFNTHRLTLITSTVKLCFSKSDYIIQMTHEFFSLQLKNTLKLTFIFGLWDSVEPWKFDIYIFWRWKLPDPWWQCRQTYGLQDASKLLTCFANRIRIIKNCSFY